ncbi:MAG: peptidylprolyl isomerase [Bacteroidota bacterium]|nr:peptidylprolyl isomerase [Bacteroidota bacterium]MDP4204382.1 peptidylprolyl isomerase [Bacteroidota bacterium]
MKKLLLPVFLILLFTWSCSKKENAKVLIQTDQGNIEVEVFEKQAPVTAKNFLKHVDKGHYNNTIFYRTVRYDNQPKDSIKIQVIQGGVFDENIIDKFKSIPHETTKKTGIKHKNGVVSMARVSPGTASTEFFICIGDQPQLDYGGKRNPDGKGFAAFAKVIKGMDVVKKIQQLQDSCQFLKKPVTIRTITREK